MDALDVINFLQDKCNPHAQKTMLFHLNKYAQKPRGINFNQLIYL